VIFVHGGGWRSGDKTAFTPGEQSFAPSATDVDRTEPPMLLVNSTGEIVPLAQAREMAARLTVAAVPHELLVLPGSRHAAQYAAAVWQQTVRFLERHLR
jgi:acetyl esterase/lipase